MEAVACPPPPRVDEIGIAPTRLADGEAEPRFIARREDQMDVVGHEAIGPDLHAASTGLLGQIAVDLLVAVFKEDRLAAVAPLGHVMRQSGHDDAGEAGHGVTRLACSEQNGDTIRRARGSERIGIVSPEPEPEPLSPELNRA